MKKLRVGVISWDCSLPPETYFGFYQTRSMSPSKFRSATPYYAEILSSDKITYHSRTQAEFDRELQYAIDAGIDYLAHVWYPEEQPKVHIPTSPNDCSHKVNELNWARRMHASSALKEKLHFCAIAGAHPFADADMEELVMGMQDPCYEKIDGRPLLYTFGGCRLDFVERVRALCKSKGFTEPFFVGMFNEGVSEPANEHKQVDALSAYACCGVGMTKYAQLAEQMIRENESRRAAANQIIPLYTVGWDPSPRNENPVPWVQYPDADYIELATGEELMEGAKLLTEWIENSARDTFAGHILTFAWNEFEEGGFICPTVGEDGKVNSTRLEDFRKVTEYWKKTL